MTVTRTSSARSRGSGKSSSRGRRKSVIRLGTATHSAPYSVRGTPSYRPYSISSWASSFSIRCRGVGSSSITIATSASASRNGDGIAASDRSTRRSNPTCCAGWRGPAADLAPRRRFGIAAYRTSVASPSEPSIALEGEPAGFVVLVEPGDRIHFLDWGGDGRPPVVLVHVLSATSLVWWPVARRLVARRRVVAMDLRGHGLSDA